MNLCQHFTPLWVAEALVERHFGDLDGTDLVLEPTCGRGAFLRALPADVPAFGVEIDPAVAEVARRESGRRVITGDFRAVQINVQPTAIIGNPPFVADLFDAVLDRAHALLPQGARAGFILPTYFFQTSSRTCRYAERWSIAQEMLPRHAFSARMRTPLVFAIFSKDARRLMVGFALYRESEDLRGLARPYRDLLQATTGSIWRAVCRLALERLGGQAELPAIYGELEANRPTRTRFWQEKIRQTLRQYPDFTALATGRYALSQRIKGTA